MSAEWSFPNRATSPGSSSYYSVRLSHPRLRDDLALLLAWQAEIASVRTRVSDPSVARLKLQWWREDSVRSRTGGAQHPLCQRLAGSSRVRALPGDLFHSVIDGAERQIAGEPIGDLDDLKRALDRDFGATFEMLSRCHGVEAGSDLDRARLCGVFCGLVYLIRDLGLALRQGRALLPLAFLRERGLRREDLLAGGTGHGTIADLLGRLAETARALDARSDPCRLPPALAMRQRILRALLEEIEAAGFSVRDQRIGLTPLRKLWIAWRARHRCRAWSPDGRGR